MHTTTGPDRLTSIAGIGPKLEQTLNGHGIATFSALASFPTAELLSLLAGRPFVTDERVHAWQAQARTLAGQRAEPRPEPPQRTVRHTFSLAVTVEVGSQRILKGSAQHLGSGDEARWVAWDMACFEGFVRERIGAAALLADDAPADHGGDGHASGDRTANVDASASPIAVEAVSETPEGLVPVRFTVLSLAPSAPLPDGSAIVELSVEPAALELPPGTVSRADATVYARLPTGEKIEAGTATARSGVAGLTSLAVEIAASPAWVGLDALVTICADEAVGPLRAVSADQATMLVRSG